MLSTIMEWIGIIATILSVPASIYFFVQFKKHRRTISWKKVKKGARQLIKIVKEVDPDLIITFSGRGAIFANLIITELENKYPIYTCLLNNKSNDTFLRPQTWSEFETSKWIGYIPDEILHYTNKRILIINDITRSGETIEKLTELLIRNGSTQKIIFSMSLMANEEVLIRSRIPQFYWRIINTIEFTMPWES